MLTGRNRVRHDHRGSRVNSSARPKVLVAERVGGLVGAVATVVAVVVGFAFVAVMMSAWLGYYYEAKLATRTPAVDRTPTW